MSSTSSQVPDSPDPPPQQGSNGGGGGRNSNAQSSANASNLYLVTFLATLFLLLFISCAIILRSYILRRRYQRHLEGHVAGMLLTPRSQGSRHGRFGHAPKLFDSWIMNGGNKWKDMRPVAAQPVFVKRKRKDSVACKTVRICQPSLSTSEPSSTHLPPSRSRLLFSRFRWPQETTPPNLSEGVEHAQYPPPVSTPKVRVEMLQISVLIAMPSRNRAMRKNALLDSINPEDDDEPPLPELSLGITKIPYRHKILDAISTPQPSPSDIPIT